MKSDQVRYIVHEPILIDWVAFLGGITVIIFSLGKLLNNLCCSKRYISPMMEHLFQVQDVSRINNVKKVNYSNKALNNPTNPYRRAQTLQGGRYGKFKLSNQQTTNQVMPLSDNQEEPKAVLDQYVAELGTDSPDLKSFRKLIENRLPLSMFRKGRLRRQLCCRTHHLDLMINGAKKHIHQELDIVRFIKKQRLHTNLLWGVSSPFQRAVCRSQSQFLLQDKLETEFASFKLQAVRRLDEIIAWQSSDSDDPMDRRQFSEIHENPTPYDLKFIKRYIAVCTPEALKLREARRRALQREFAPSVLPQEKRFADNKEQRIERLRKKALQHDMEKSYTQQRQRKQNISDLEKTEPGTHVNRSTMPRLDLEFKQLGNLSVQQRS